MRVVEINARGNMRNWRDVNREETKSALDWLMAQLSGVYSTI